MKILKQQIKKALTCDSGCGHKLDPEICFKHQCGRIEKIMLSKKRELLEKFEEIISREWDKI